MDLDLESVERRARLFRAVETLPKDQRKVILFRFGEEKTIREIASGSIAAKVQSSNFNFGVWKIFVHDCASND